MASSACPDCGAVCEVCEDYDEIFDIVPAPHRCTPCALEVARGRAIAPDIPDW